MGEVAPSFINEEGPLEGPMRSEGPLAQLALFVAAAAQLLFLPRFLPVPHLGT